MTRDELIRILMPLTLAHGRPFDQPVWTMYYKALQDVPAPLLESAVDAAIKLDSKFIPKPGELRTMAEQCRQALIAANPYKPGACCNYSGWVEAIEADGVKRASRCPCRRSYLAGLDTLGLIGPSLVAPKQLEAAFDARMTQAGGEE